MEAVVLVGIQASGKSTFFRERFFRTHVRINLDMLRTRHRERMLLEACIASKQPFVVDNTNPEPSDRARYILPAREHGFRVVGYFFRSSIAESLVRNAARDECERVSELAIRGTRGRLVVPSLDEGFDALSFVRVDAAGGFTVEAWREAR